jgi:ABC-type glutathione transport system ATPase component
MQRKSAIICDRSLSAVVIALRMSLVLTSHDMAIAGGVADRVAVMKEGEIVETGPVTKIFAKPAHAYTRRLFDAIPGRHPVRVSGAGNPPSAMGTMRRLMTRGAGRPAASTDASKLWLSSHQRSACNGNTSCGRNPLCARPTRPADAGYLTLPQRLYMTK